MILAIDIGNTTVALGGIRDGRVCFVAHMDTVRTRTAAEYRTEMEKVFSHRRHPEKPIRFEGRALGFAYRHSAMMDAGVIVTDVTLRLTPGDPDAIARRTEELLVARREKQPLEYPSAGSTFKRPEGAFAAKLIDDAGLKGLRIGDAQVSEKHAGFIVNLGSATASDILALMAEVQSRVLAASGITLEPEVRILGEDA